jgi:hypothetical protein
MRKEFEDGLPSKTIGAHFGVTDSAVYLRAKAGGWKRGERLTQEKTSRPKSGAATSATTAPRFEEPTKLSGKVRCTECESWTSTDPCEFCGKKQRKNWR